MDLVPVLPVFMGGRLRWALITLPRGGPAIGKVETRPRVAAAPCRLCHLPLLPRPDRGQWAKPVVTGRGRGACSVNAAALAPTCSQPALSSPWGGEWVERVSLLALAGAAHQGGNDSYTAVLSPWQGLEQLSP